MAKDAYTPFCSGNQHFLHEGYLNGIMLELSSPFSLEYLSVDQKIAEFYLENITKVFRSLSPDRQTKKNFESLRTAYIVFKVKIFAYGADVRGSARNTLTQMLGALEGYEVYSDPQLKKLMYSRSFITRTDASRQNARLIQEYDILRDRSANGGILTNVN